MARSRTGQAFDEWMAESGAASLDLSMGSKDQLACVLALAFAAGGVAACEMTAHDAEPNAPEKKR